MTDYNELIARVRSPFALTERDAQEIADALEAQARRLAYLGGTVEVLAVENEELRARIAVLDAALTKAATRLKEVHSKGRASRAQYKIYADEAYAALKGER